MDGYVRAEISVSALQHNIDLLRGVLSPGAGLCAVVKANAYGHGLRQVMGVMGGSADMLGVASCSEAVSLREMGWQRPILQFALSGAMDVDALGQLIVYNILLSLTHREELPLLAEAAGRVGRPARVHIKIDTGMTRSGVLAENLPELYRLACDNPSIHVVGMYTHFACSEDPDKQATLGQLARLKAALAACGNPQLCLHAANSAAVLDLPQTHLTMVRPGLALYGIQPGSALQCKLPLRPAMRITAPIVLVKDVPAGAKSGYGWTYRFDKPARMALVPIGYADGYFRAFSNQAVMQVRGVDCPVRGRVSMDQTVIEVTHLPPVHVGEEAVVISSDPAAPNSLENLARLADTIPYEVVCRLGDRITRQVVA